MKNPCPLYPEKNMIWKDAAAATAAKSLQSCLTLCDPIDGSPPGSPVPAILQARILECVAISFSNAWKWSVSVVSDSQRPHGLQPTRLLCPWDFPGKSTGVGCHCLLQIWKDTCAPVFTAALFTIAKTWKQPRCPLSGKWIKKCGTYTQWNRTQPFRRMK